MGITWTRSRNFDDDFQDNASAAKAYARLVYWSRNHTGEGWQKAQQTRDDNYLKSIGFNQWGLIVPDSGIWPAANAEYASLKRKYGGSDY